MTPVRFQYIGFKQSIMLDPLEVNVVIGENMTVIFQILANFLFAGIFKPVFQFSQNIINGQLFDRFNRTVGERNIGRKTWFDGKGNSDQSGFHGIQGSRFRVQRSQFGPIDFTKPVIKLFFGQYRFIFLFSDKFTLLESRFIE